MHDWYMCYPRMLYIIACFLLYVLRYVFIGTGIFFMITTVFTLLVWFSINIHARAACYYHVDGIFDDAYDDGFRDES